MYQYNSGLRQRRGLCGCIGGIVALLLLLGGLGFVLSRAHNGVAMSVGAHPTIIGDDCTGTILVQVGPANQVNLSGVFPLYSQDSSTNTVTLNECDGLTITVPPQADLRLDADEITVIGVSGIMNLSVNGGPITLEQVTLEGQSKVDDNGGPIVFSGNVAQGSAPTISNNSGSIDMTLPASASFHLALTGILGPISSNFPAVENQTNGVDLSSVEIDVGSNPSAVKLTLDLNDTAVVLRGAP